MEYKQWNLAPAKWTAVVRRRLFLDVIPAERQCPYCHWQRCDTKRNHAVMCKGGPSRTWRHSSIRDLVAKAIENVGFRVQKEHSGNLSDGRKPGDVIVYNWTRDKHLLIDVGITNPLAAHNRTELLRSGPGGGAANTAEIRKKKYWDLDKTKYICSPFILETSGAFGQPALKLSAKLRKIWMSKSCNGRHIPNHNPRLNPSATFERPTEAR